MIDSWPVVAWLAIFYRPSFTFAALRSVKDGWQKMVFEIAFSQVGDFAPATSCPRQKHAFSSQGFAAF
jgi:hypothetical protein